jgi:DNA-binding HxlR family transcriptional regulator
LTGQTATGQPGSASGRDHSAELTTANTLRLLSAGASGAILMALGEGPLRTKELTERVRGYTSRTVYRYARKLSELGVIVRREEPGVPSKVVHSLSDPCGRELRDLVEAYAKASLSRLPNGEIDAHAWGSLALLADLWESGMIEALNRGTRSLTELAQGEHGLSYHQVSRRASLFVIGGFIEEVPGGGRRRCYALTDKARRGMALIAGVGRWRRRHVVPAGASGLDAGEAAGALRAALPLVTVPEHGGKGLELEVGGQGEDGGREMVWARVEANGSVLSRAEPPQGVEGRAAAGVSAWVDAVLDGFHDEIRTEGDSELIETCVSRLHAVLWQGPGSLDAAAAAPAAPGR